MYNKRAERLQAKIVELTRGRIISGPHLRLARRKLGLSQNKLAEMVGHPMTAATISLLERGLQPVSATMLVRLVDAFTRAVELRKRQG